MAKKVPQKKIYQKSKFAASRATERKFEQQLLKVARESNKLIKRFTNSNGEVVDFTGLQAALNEYAKKLEPWAKVQAAKMLQEVNRRVLSDQAYKKMSQRISKQISVNVLNSEIGLTAYSLLLEEVKLITSIPIEAGERVVKLSTQAVATGTRAENLIKQISQTLDVTENRARLIARTEVAKANTMLNLARAKSVGSTQYIWRNSGDGAVRESHRFYKGEKLDGKVFSWDAPPTLDDGMTGHAGTFPNCRCYAEPILPEE